MFCLFGRFFGWISAQKTYTQKEDPGEHFSSADVALDDFWYLHPFNLFVYRSFKKKSCHPRVFSKMASSSDNFVGFRPWNIWYSDFFRIPAFSKERSNISGGKNPQKRMFVQLPESTKTTKSMVEKIQGEWTNRELFSGFFWWKKRQIFIWKKKLANSRAESCGFRFFYQRNRFWSWFVDLPNNPNTCIQNNPSDRFKLTKTPKISPD